MSRPPVQPRPDRTRPVKTRPDRTHQRDLQRSPGPTAVPLLLNARRAELATRFRERQDRGLDVVYRFRLHPSPGFEFVSPSVTDLIGWTPQELYDRPEILYDLTFPEDLDRVRLMFQGEFPLEQTDRLRWRRRDGTHVWTEQRLTPVIEDGRCVAIEGSARDITDRVEAEDQLRQSEGRLRAMLHDVEVCSVAINLDGTIAFANPFLGRLREISHERLQGLDWFETCVSQTERPAIRAQMLAAFDDGARTFRFDCSMPTESGGPRQVSWSAAPIHDATGELTGIVALGDDVTASRQARAVERRLMAAVEQTAESVMITDRDGLITYVNPAFERVSGYASGEVIGRNPKLIQSGRQDEAFYAALWAVLTAGETWSGELVNRRKDGRLYVEEGTITPVRDAAGTITNFVAVKRDVSRERALQSSILAAQAERLSVARMIAEFESGPTVQETATAVVTAIVALPDVDAAWMIAFEPDGRGVVFAGSPAPFPADLVGTEVPADVLADMRARCAAGPWVSPWAPVGRDGVWVAGAVAAGITATASAPIGNGSGAVALLRIATAHPAGVERIGAHTPALAELAAGVRPLLEPALRARWTAEATRARLRTILADAAFTPNFQPVVRLSDGETVGFEALTRFADGTPPDVVFADATAVGLGLEFEIGALAAAMEAAEQLPVGPWLSLNVSPRTILDNGHLRSALAGRTRPTVLELTEHERIDDYPAIRSAIVALGPDLRIAVDDAGAGIANFSHLVELRPDFVKIDIGLVRGVNADLTRQALVVGLRHFAQAMDRDVIAEGIETEAERRTLQSLGIEYGQGFLFGRPAPAAKWAVADASTR